MSVLAVRCVKTGYFIATTASQDRDGIPPIRTNDMFFGGSERPDWVNLDKVAIPQADELQRPLGNLILHLGL